MIIQTKHNIGDEVYVISDGILILRKISEIQTSVRKYNGNTNQIGHIKVVYGWIGATTYYFDEESCWSTVDEFVNYSIDINQPS